MSEVFRSCAAIVLIRPAEICSPDGCGTVYQVLLVHKPRKNDAWQLPQGGCEKGESLEQAALRELQEEAGIQARVLGVSDIVYQYAFPSSYRRFRPDNVCGQRVQFVVAEPASDAPVTVDGHEIDGYVWALLEQLPQYIHREEYRKMVETLIQEGIALIEKS